MSDDNFPLVSKEAVRGNIAVAQRVSELLSYYGKHAVSIVWNVNTGIATSSLRGDYEMFSLHRKYLTDSVDYIEAGERVWHVEATTTPEGVDLLTVWLIRHTDERGVFVGDGFRVADVAVQANIINIVAKTGATMFSSWDYLPEEVRAIPLKLSRKERENSDR